MVGGEKENLGEVVKRKWVAVDVRDTKHEEEKASHPQGF